MGQDKKIQEEIDRLNRENRALKKELALKSNFTQLSIDQAGEAAFWIDHSGGIMYANQSACTMLGYSSIELINMTVHDIDIHFPQNRWKERWQNIKKLKNSTMESFFRTKEGMTIPVEIKGNFIADNEVECLFVLFSDISVRKDIQQALKESEQKYKDVFNATSDMIIVQDAKSCKILDVNDRVFNLYGYTKDEVIGKTIELFFCEDQKGNFLTNQQRIEESIRKGKQQFQWKSQKKNGELFWVEVTIHLSEIVGEGRILATVRDIDSRKKVETVLKEQEVMLRTIFEAAPIGIGLVKDRILQECNEAFTRMVGFSENELKGKNVRFLYPSQDEFERVGCDKYSDIRKCGAGSLETQLRRKDGRVFDVLLSSAALEKKDVSGTLVFTALDISYLKNAERNLMEALKKAQLADRMKSAFLATMSHEMRTPLNSILGFTELLRAEDLERKQHKFVSLISDNAKLLLSLISDILDFSSIEAGSIKLEKDVCDLKEILTSLELNADAYLKLTGKDVKLSTISSLDIADCIETDSVRLQQILNNLVMNAIKFTEAGSVTVGVDLLDGKMLHFFVKDTGIGIDPKNFKSLFEPFEQVEMHDSRKYGGVGLGLAICKRLIALFGGKIWVESKTDKPSGTTFHFTIPYSSTSKRDNLKKQEKAAVKTGTVSSGLPMILVVDDNKDSLELMQHMLLKIKTKVLLAENGRQAIEVYKQEPNLDLILMDLQMPVMDGFEAVRQIRGIEKNSGRVPIRIVALTAAALGEEKEKCLESGMDDCLLKPVNITQIRSILSA